MDTSYPSSSKNEHWTAPDLEPDRLWKEPEVIIYNIFTYPGVSSSASAYDVANRRWYELNLDTVYQGGEEWLAETIATQIKDHHSTHGTLPDFNVINTTEQGTPMTFEKKPYHEVARRIRGNFRYGGEMDILPTTTFDQIKEKIHLSCSSDRCKWKGRDCVFKRIEFHEDLAVIEREIGQREKLIRTLDDGSDDSLEARYRILPILAVVHKHANTNEVIGLLFPYGGRNLEDLAGGCDYGMGEKVDLYNNGDEGDEEGIGKVTEEPANVTANKPEPSTFPRLPITEVHFQGLVKAVWDLSRAGVLHGDITDRNTLLTPDGHLVLIDLGEIAPNYKGDAHALGKMMDWVCERVNWDEEVLARVRTIAACLQSITDPEAIRLAYTT